MQAEGSYQAVESWQAVGQAVEGLAGGGLNSLCSEVLAGEHSRHRSSVLETLIIMCFAGNGVEENWSVKHIKIIMCIAGIVGEEKWGVKHACIIMCFEGIVWEERWREKRTFFIFCFAGNEWEEKWGEKHAALGEVNKYADKWAKDGDDVWHERWGEDYDGKGACKKWTDKWAERLVAGELFFPASAMHWFAVLCIRHTRLFWTNGHV